MKKIITCICLSIFLSISILKPIKAFAYNDLDTYVSSDLTTEEFHDSFIGSIIAGLLESGGSIYIPAGLTTDEFYEEIADTLYEVSNQDIWDNAWNYYMKYPSLTFDQMPYYMWSDTPSYGTSKTPSFVQLGLDVLLNTWENEEIETYEPDPDYSYVSSFTDFVLSNRSWNDTKTFISSDLGIVYYVQATNGPYNFNKSAYTYYLYNQNESFFGSVAGFGISTICTFYITFNNNEYIVTCTGFGNPNFTPGQPWVSGNYIIRSFNYFDFVNNVGQFRNLNGATNNTDQCPQSFSTLDDALRWIGRHFRHFNLYVDNVPWINLTPNDPIQIGGNTYITNTNTPVDYDFPPGTYFSPNYLKSILRQLIDANNTGVGITIRLDDILDAFVDQDGVTAVYTLNVVRTDYDELIFEQYGSKNIRSYNGLYFPKDELTNYNETANYITTSSFSMIPSDILTPLAACGVLILIAYLINRMLE